MDYLKRAFIYKLYIAIGTNFSRKLRLLYMQRMEIHEYKNDYIYFPKMSIF